MKKNSTTIKGILKAFTVSLLLLGTTSLYCASLSFLDGKTFSPTGLNSTKTIHVNNTSGVYEAFEIIVFNRDLDINGQDILSTTNDFIIEPRQVLVEPNSELFVTCSYVGPEEIEVEQAYRFKFKAVPLSQSIHREKLESVKASGAVGVVLHYMKSAYVSSNKFQPKIEISNGIYEKDKDDTEWLKMVFVNTGTKHQLLKDVELIIYLDNKNISLNPQELNKFLILANSKIEKRIPWPQDVIPNNLNLGINL